ncbi:hypothetical protein SYJ56_20340 [Algoriphagus sp. D3-2-R+10]|uniref:hypothetical protein n=1 Tax=Algoriphagus aurantiacus TaxID=3103948 RepID=UPI002B3E69DC|nr:hypothetical protein [Algoriphagus sp. D3-2-R+10]MEB2777676.1 hypothetical protein [Algoriphagus sp. D3-2-R+10]
MKSSMSKATHSEMIIHLARFSRTDPENYRDGTGYSVSFVTGQVMTNEKQKINR